MADIKHESDSLRSLHAKNAGFLHEFKLNNNSLLFRWDLKEINKDKLKEYTEKKQAENCKLIVKDENNKWYMTSYKFCREVVQEQNYKFYKLDTGKYNELVENRSIVHILPLEKDEFSVLIEKRNLSMQLVDDLLNKYYKFQGSLKLIYCMYQNGDYILTRIFEHDNHVVLAWMLDNVTVDEGVKLLNEKKDGKSENKTYKEMLCQPGQLSMRIALMVAIFFKDLPQVLTCFETIFSQIITKEEFFKRLQDEIGIETTLAKKLNAEEKLHRKFKNIIRYFFQTFVKETITTTQGIKNSMKSAAIAAICERLDMTGIIIKRSQSGLLSFRTNIGSDRKPIEYIVSNYGLNIILDRKEVSPSGLFVNARETLLHHVKGFISEAFNDFFVMLEKDFEKKVEKLNQFRANMILALKKVADFCQEATHQEVPLLDKRMSIIAEALADGIGDVIFQDHGKYKKIFDFFMKEFFADFSAEIKDERVFPEKPVNQTSVFLELSLTEIERHAIYIKWLVIRGNDKKIIEYVNQLLSREIKNTLNEEDLIFCMCFGYAPILKHHADNISSLTKITDNVRKIKFAENKKKINKLKLKIKLAVLSANVEFLATILAVYFKTCLDKMKIFITICKDNSKKLAEILHKGDLKEIIKRFTGVVAESLMLELMRQEKYKKFEQVDGFFIKAAQLMKDLALLDSSHGIALSKETIEYNSFTSTFINELNSLMDDNNSAEESAKKLTAADMRRCDSVSIAGEPRVFSILSQVNDLNFQPWQLYFSELLRSVVKDEGLIKWLTCNLNQHKLTADDGASLQILFKQALRDTAINLTQVPSIFYHLELENELLKITIDKAFNAKIPHDDVFQELPFAEYKATYVFIPDKTRLRGYNLKLEKITVIFSEAVMSKKIEVNLGNKNKYVVIWELIKNKINVSQLPYHTEKYELEELLGNKVKLSQLTFGFVFVSASDEDKLSSVESNALLNSTPR